MEDEVRGCDQTFNGQIITTTNKLIATTPLTACMIGQCLVDYNPMS